MFFCTHLLDIKLNLLHISHHMKSDSPPLKNPSSHTTAEESKDFMAQDEWIYFNFRSQHFTFDRWKTLTEINLKRCLSANLSRLRDRERKKKTLHIYSRMVTFEIQMRYFITQRRKKKGDVWNRDGSLNKAWMPTSTGTWTWQDIAQLIRLENGQSLLAWPLVLKIL